jgi:hypothetical protein
VYRYVRTSAAFAAASLGDDPLGACELDPSVRPAVGADALFAVPIFCAGAAAGVEPTARPSPLKFLSDGLPKQLPMVKRPARWNVVKYVRCFAPCRSIARLGAVNAMARLHVPSRVELGWRVYFGNASAVVSLAPVCSKGQEQVRHRRHRIAKPY